ncbi:thioredoxin-like domain-containing protein [Spirosoma areae]
MMCWLLWGLLWELATTSAEPVIREPPCRVLIFWDTECPVCQKTTSRIQKMASQYRSRVRFEAVYPTQTTTLADIRAFERDYKLTLPHRLDPAHKLVTQYNVTTTPEVLLLSGEGKVLYRGSIDDQFYRLGRSRPAPTAFYLKDALNATLTGKPVVVRQTTPTGCLINR